jgi:hypothetical protein
MQNFISRKFQDIETREIVPFDALLNNNLSVILGEPASGKTEQLKQFQKEKSDEVHFMPLVNLGLQDQATLENKKYVLLDSIDETLRSMDYKNYKQLQEKINQYIESCKNQNPHIKFILTCRQFEWNEYFQETLKSLDKTLKVYQIEDLTNEEINILLAQKEINTDEFWHFISENYLEFLLKNILVILSIIDNYGTYKHEKLSYIDIYTYLVKDYLSVKGRDREPISENSLTKLFNIASSLATYMLLNRKPSVSFQNSSRLADELYKIDNQVIKMDDLKVILGTSLFRKEGEFFSFFHPSVQEFLMAYFINEKKLDIKTIKELFSHELRFYKEFEEVIIYLTNLNDALFDEFVRFDPFIFKRHPMLSQEQQEKLLNSMLYKLKNDKSMVWGRWHDFEGTTLVKFDTLNLPSLIQKNIKSSNIDNVVFAYLMALLEYNYSRELEDLIFKYLEDYSNIDPSNHEEYDAISHSKFEGNKKLRELIEKNFIDNFAFNKRLFEFSKEKNLINSNSEKISVLDFETMLFESLYGIKYENRYGNEKQARYIDTKFNFNSLLELLDAIPSRQLQYIVPYLKPEDSLKWFEHIKGKGKREKYFINCWCLYAVLLHNHSKSVIQQVFEFLKTHSVHVATDINKMPFDFESIANNFWEVYFSSQSDRFFLIDGLLRLLRISFEDIKKIVPKYPIENHIDYYIWLRLNQDIENYLMENKVFKEHMNIRWEAQKRQQEEWDKELSEELANSEDYQQRIQQEANYKKICEDSLKALATKKDFYNVFICEEIFEEENKGKLLELLTREQHEKLLDFIKNDFIKDQTYKKIKDSVNANSYNVFPTARYIYLFEKCDNETITNLIQTKEDFEKIFFHTFRFHKMEEKYFIFLANEYFDYFVESLHELINLSLEQSQNQDVASLHECRVVMQKIGKFNKNSLLNIINYFLSLDKNIFKSIKEESKVEEILKIISLDKQNYDFIDKLKNTDSNRSSLYLQSLLQIDAKKALDSFFSEYQKVPSKIKFYKLKRFFRIIKSDEEKKNRYDKPSINPLKIQLFIEIISALKKIKSIELLEERYILIIINDYYQLFYEYEGHTGSYSPDRYDGMYEYISYLWNSLGADSSHIGLLQKLSKSKCKNLATRAKHHLNEAYNHQNKDRCHANIYYKKIFDKENIVDISKITKLKNKWGELTMPEKLGAIGSISSIIGLVLYFMPTSSTSDTINATNNTQSQIIQNNHGNVTINIDNSKNETTNNLKIGDNINELLRENQKNIRQGNHNQEEKTKLNSEAFILGKSIEINNQNMTIAEKNKECKNQANMVVNYIQHDLNLMNQICDEVFK